MLNKVQKTINEYSLLEKGDKVLVALSGGCDSVCLCLALKELGCNVGVAHLNHNIRDDAKRDEDFVKEFAQRHNFECHVKSVDIVKLAEEEKISLESAGRNARYSFFEELCDKYSYNKIAVAHNKNDNCETFLLNLIRGSGLKGLTGIPVKRGNIVRPLINTDRTEIEKFVAEKGESFVTDKTNFENDYTRNKIRNIIIPKILEINDNFIDGLSNTIKIADESVKYIDLEAVKIIEFENDTAKINTEKFLSVPNAVSSRALMLCFEHAAGTSKDFEKKHIEAIYRFVEKKSHGKIIDLCFDTECVSEYGNIIFRKKKISENYEYKLTPGGKIYIGETGLTITTEITDKNFKREKGCQYFDLDMIKGDITVRCRKDGDRIIPFKMKSEKKLKEIMINKKISRNIRDSLPVFEYDGQIIMVYDVIRSDLFKVTERSEKILKIKGESHA